MKDSRRAFFGRIAAAAGLGPALLRRPMPTQTMGEAYQIGGKWYKTITTIVSHKNQTITLRTRTVPWTD